MNYHKVQPSCPPQTIFYQTVKTDNSRMETVQSAEMDLYSKISMFFSSPSITAQSKSDSSNNFPSKRAPKCVFDTPSPFRLIASSALMKATGLCASDDSPPTLP